MKVDVEETLGGECCRPDLSRAMGSSETAWVCWRLLLSEGSLEPTLGRAGREGVLVETSSGPDGHPTAGFLLGKLSRETLTDPCRSEQHQEAAGMIAVTSG